jgi:hypothetical protein
MEDRDEADTVRADHVEVNAAGLGSGALGLY